MSIESNLEKAQRYLGEDDFKTALDWASKVLAEVPEHPEALTVVASCQLAAGQIPEAYNTLQSAMDKGTKPEFYIVLGDVHVALDQSLEALNAYQRAIQMDNQCSEAYLKLGKQLVATGDLRQGEEVYLQLLKKSPESPEAQHQLGTLYIIAGEHQRAVECMQKALAHDDTNALYLDGLARATELSGDIEQAIELYSKATEAEPAIFPPRYHLALIFGGNGLYAEAVRLLCEAADLEPDNIHVLHALALYAGQSGQQAIAKETYDELLPRAEGHDFIFKDYARFLIESEQNKKAVDILDELLAKDSAAPEVRTLLALAATQGQAKRVKQILSKADVTGVASEAPSAAKPQMPAAHRNEATLPPAIGDVQIQNNIPGDPTLVETEFQKHNEMAVSTMPGFDYTWYLKRFHETMKPRSYVEIGVETGRTLALALPQTKALGIDPEPQINVQLKSNMQLFPLTSDAFFEQYEAPKILQTDTIDFAFIDGLHVFEQVLRDFMNVESNAHKNTVVCFHDCYPLDAKSAQPNRVTRFWTGDPWRIIPCLKAWRSDLKVFTIKTYPTGLGVVTNLNPKSKVLHTHYEDVVKSFQHYDYDKVDADKDGVLNALPNDWGLIAKTLMEQGVPLKDV